MTADYIGPELFVSLRSPRKPISFDTINGITMRWLHKDLFELGALDVESFAAHSTRGATATTLIYLGVDPHVVAALGDWSCFDVLMFHKFYDRCRAMFRISQILVPTALASEAGEREAHLAIQ